MITEDILVACARKGAQLYAEQHPRPIQVNMTQAGEMLGLSMQTVSKMVKEGRIALNRLGTISVTEIDRVLLIR